VISRWATELNVSVRKSEDRPDKPAGDSVYRLVDLFTTHSGSWEPAERTGSITPWAREKYLRPLGAPDFFDDAGGDHHLFARVLDADGRPVLRDDLIRYWSDGFERLGDSGYAGYVFATPKQKSGWANQPAFNSFSPERGEQGAWCWCPDGASDVVIGGGLPNNQHVSFFAVWQEQSRQDAEDRDTPDVHDDERRPVLDLESIRKQVWKRAGVSFDRESIFANHARMHNLGAPLTDEFDAGRFRVQGFANGIVYAPAGEWERTDHMGW
jgi:hypothetical protein